MLAFHPLAATELAGLAGADGSAIGGAHGIATVTGVSASIAKAAGASEGVATVSGVGNGGSFYCAGTATGTSAVNGVSRRDVLKIARSEGYDPTTLITKQITVRLTV
jgi:hypothetical protein